jgi:hypothetical protein
MLLPKTSFRSAGALSFRHGIPEKVAFLECEINPGAPPCLRGVVATLVRTLRVEAGLSGDRSQIDAHTRTLSPHADEGAQARSRIKPKGPHSDTFLHRAAATAATTSAASGKRPFARLATVLSPTFTSKDTAASRHELDLYRELGAERAGDIFGALLIAAGSAIGEEDLRHDNPPALA